MARTGSGKTIAFGIPLVERLLQGNHHRALILSPTRELSMQTLRVMQRLTKSLRCVGIHGGEGMEKQFDLLSSNPNIIVATPGRLAHHLSEIKDFSLKQTAVCVLDEADRLMEMGFGPQIRIIFQRLPEICQKMCVSATLPSQLVEFTKLSLQDPNMVRLEHGMSEDLRCAFILSRTDEKEAVLLRILEQIRGESKTLIFVATRHYCEYVCALLEQEGYAATMIYGTLDAQARRENLADFSGGRKPILVTTDVAARGIDIPLLDHVVHYHHASSAKLFVHRSGRAARAGRIGYCWAMANPEEVPYMMDVLLYLNVEISNGDSTYTLESMTPSMVHYGMIPNLEMPSAVDADLQRVCKNSWKQYIRTRPEASREAVRKAKALLEGAKLKTGQRVRESSLQAHPLFRDETESVDRQEWLAAVASYRPKETIFEAGKRRVDQVVSHVDKGRTSSKRPSGESALLAMRDMRRQMRIVRDQSCVVAGSELADELNNKVEEEEEVVEDEHEETKPEPKPQQPDYSKRRMSKAERKRLKKGAASATSSTAAVTFSKPAKTMRGHDFRDENFYVSDEIDLKERRIEAALQPNAGIKKVAAMRLEEAMLDIVGDERDDLVQRQRMMRWNKSKRKYMATTVGSELSGDSKTKKMRLESGQLVKTSKLKLGELYEKWQKKTNRSIGRNGVFDDNEGTMAGQSRGKGAHDATDEAKSAATIRKERQKKQNMKLKNMKKADRRHVEKKQREVRNRAKKAVK